YPTMDSRYGVLLGTRNGDTFYGFDRVVQDADTNAARNIPARQGDKEISLFTLYKQVKAILLRRTAEVQTRLGNYERKKEQELWKISIRFCCPAHGTKARCTRIPPVLMANCHPPRARRHTAKPAITL